jgi:putative chitinase
MTGLEILQTKIGVTPDGSFGPKTLKAAALYLKLSPEKAAHFFGQTSHETGGFTLFTENLMYGLNGLRKTFGKYFPTDASTNGYVKQPVKIASKVYGSRMGNGDEASKEGYTFRGRGALQITGKANYKLFSEYVKNPDIMINPDLVASDYCFESAMFYFDKNKLWAIADKGVNDTTILSITKKINGGTNGLVDRSELTKEYYSWLTA